jgi:hypothetical protein
MPELGFQTPEFRCQRQLHSHATTHGQLHT